MILPACSAPTLDQLAATAQYIAGTGAALTLQALPTSTPIPSATFSFDGNSIYGNVYLEYRFSDSFAILLPIGEYHYRVWIGDKGPREATFRIGNHDKHTLIFSARKIQFIGP